VQDLKRAAFRRFRKLGLRPFPLIELIDARRHWPASTRFNHGLDNRSGPGENGFNRSVAAVTDPPTQSALHRLIFDKGTIANPLHPAPHHDVTNDIVTHA
jgi:hypothetical protein